MPVEANSAVLHTTLASVEDKGENEFQISTEANFEIEGIGGPKQTMIHVCLLGSSGKGKPVNSSERIFNYARVAFSSNRSFYFESHMPRRSLAS